MNIFVTFIVVAVVSGSSPKDAAIRNQLVIMHDMSDLYDRSMTELTSFAGFSRFMIGDAEAMVDNVVYAHAIMRDSQSMHARHRVDDGSTLSSSPIGVTIDGATQLQVVAGHYQDAMTRLVQTLPLSQEPTLASHIAALTQVSNEWKRIAVRAKVHRATLIRDRETLESSWPSAEPITTSMDPNEFAEPVTTRAPKVKQAKNKAPKAPKVSVAVVATTATPTTSETTMAATLVTQAEERITAPAEPIDLTGFHTVVKRSRAAVPKQNKRSTKAVTVTLRPTTTSSMTAASTAVMVVTTAAPMTSTVAQETTVTTTEVQTTTASPVKTTVAEQTTVTTTEVQTTTISPMVTTVADQTTVTTMEVDTTTELPATTVSVQQRATRAPRRNTGAGRNARQLDASSSPFVPAYSPLAVEALTRQLCSEMYDVGEHLSRASALCAMIMATPVDAHTFHEMQNFANLMPWAGQVVTDMQGSAAYMNQASSNVVASYGLAPAFTPFVPVVEIPSATTHSPLGSVVGTTAAPTIAETVEAGTTTLAATTDATTDAPTTTPPATTGSYTTTESLKSTEPVPPLTETPMPRAVPSFVDALRKNLPAETPARDAATIVPSETSTSTADEGEWIAVNRKHRK